MAVWSTKRRFLYGGSFFVIMALLFGGIFLKAFYRTPTCTDGRQNGDEKGIDCGGACKKICANDTLAPVVLWSKVFNISGDVYSAVAYIENPNISSENSDAKYEFRIFDDKNRLISIKEGHTTVPKGKKFAVFETGLVIKNNKPKSADFKFLSFANWEKNITKEPELALTYSSLISATTSPSITGTIRNESNTSLPSVELAVFVLDSNENVVAASRSFVDKLLKQTTQDFVFTWPKPFNLGVEACLAPLDIAVLLDKSGSMRSEGNDPPEPYTTVINTAQSFINNLTDDDQISVVSFGNISKKESDLSLNKQLAITATNNIFFSTTTLEQTNITGGLTDALNELKSSRGRIGSKKAIVLLTDGIPTEPTKEGVADYPIISAEVVANEIKTNGIALYTIGLGKNVSEGFLKSISTEESHYFNAPSKETLSNIYKKIGQDLCPRKPNVITVIYRIL